MHCTTERPVPRRTGSGLDDASQLGGAKRQNSNGINSAQDAERARFLARAYWLPSAGAAELLVRIESLELERDAVANEFCLVVDSLTAAHAVIRSLIRRVEALEGRGK